MASKGTWFGGREGGETQHSEWRCKITEVGEEKQRGHGSIVARGREKQRGIKKDLVGENIVKGDGEGRMEIKDISGGARTYVT